MFKSTLGMLLVLNISFSLIGMEEKLDFSSRRGDFVLTLVGNHRSVESLTKRVRELRGVISDTEALDVLYQKLKLMGKISTSK